MGSGGSSCCSLLDSASVMVLVAGQGGAAGKCLLAVGIWALVRALARVNAAMARQRAGITEGLVSSLVRYKSRSETVEAIPFHIARTCEASRQCGHVGGPSVRNAG